MEEQGVGQHTVFRAVECWEHSTFQPHHSPTPLPLKCWRWYSHQVCFTHAAPYQWMGPQRAPSCLQPHCPWTCSVLCLECLFSALLFSRSNLRDFSSREALSVFPRENPLFPPLCSNRIQSAPLLQCLSHHLVIMSWVLLIWLSLYCCIASSLRTGVLYYSFRNSTGTFNKCLLVVSSIPPLIECLLHARDDTKFVR